ncbi:MAG: DNA repair protein RecN [bacterium]|nr:DNA repair protein RecN [bacterium]
MIKLSRLALKNFAVVSSADINFADGFTAITGETGAGKSLIVGAISLLLGERSSSDFIRAGATIATIEGEFTGDIASLNRDLADDDIALTGSSFTITREIQSDGKSRALINDQRVNVATLKKIGDRICDLHGQHQHQWLLDSDRHLWFLDRYGQCADAFSAYTAALSEYRTAQSRILSLARRIAENNEKQELYRFQLQEIDTVAILPNEEDSLESERKQLENVLKIRTALESSVALIESDNGAAHISGEILKNLRSIAESYPAVAEYEKEIESVKISFTEIARSLNQSLAGIAEDPARLEQIGERLSDIYNLKRKYGGTVTAVLDYAGKIRSALDSNDSMELELAALKRNLEPLQTFLLTTADKLQHERETAAKKLSKSMKKELSELGLPKAEFVVKFSAHASGELLNHQDKSINLGEQGPMAGEFFFNANAGEEAKPLVQVASGGEVSRVMLALKSLIAGNDRVGLLVFDEIDAGIGGETALLVARKLKQLAARQQLIVITHLQQIASFADHHLKAIKREVAKRTESELIPLTREERVVELGRMISGGDFGDIERKQAEKLLKMAREE